MQFTKNKGAWIIAGIILFATLFFAVLILATPQSASRYLPERDTGYEISNYKVTMTVNEDKTLNITEEITANFLEASHGIYRYIPLRQEVSYLDKNGKVQSKNYKSSISNFKFYSTPLSLLGEEEDSGYMFYQMGTYRYYLTGENTFKFSYTYSLPDDRDTIEDVFYYNIIGTGWDTNINNVNFKITFPSSIEDQDFRFYVGEYGQDYTGTDPRLSFTKTGNTILGSCTNLKYGEAITTFNVFEEGYFKTTRSYLLDILIAVLTLATFGLALLLFFKRRRKEPLVEVVEFKAPSGITPTEAGYINDGKVTGDDISALIVYWASKGYVKLETTSKDNVLITKLSDLPANAKSHEKIFFKALFTNREKVNSNSLTSLSPETGLRCVQSVEKDNAKYFDKKSDKYFGLLSLLTVLTLGINVFKIIRQSSASVALSIVFVAMIIIFAFSIMILPETYKTRDKLTKGKFTPLLIANLLFVFAPLIVIAVLMETYVDPFMSRFYFLLIPLLLTLIYPFLEQYTTQGKKILGELRGLKNFILVAEKDRIQMLVEDNPTIFYEILPYAYVLGVSKVYMDKFKDVKIGEIANFETHGNVWFGIYIINSSIRSTSYAVTRSMHPIPQRNSGGSGGFGSGGSSGGSFGGGGFSGGGFGGGGGGRF